MNLQKRRIIAFIAGRLIAGKNSGAVYDYLTSSHTNVSGEVLPNRINVYD